MKLPEIKRLAQEHTVSELEAASQEFESSLTNSLNAKGDDDGEILSHMLMAIEVRKKIDSGLSLNDAVKDFSGRVRGVLS